jgi:hypothetical protein
MTKGYHNPNRYIDQPGLEKQKKPDGRPIQEHMQDSGVPGVLGKRPKTTAELLEEGIVIETVHGIPEASIGIIPESDAVADERNVQSDIDRVIKQYDDELAQLRRSPLFNEEAERDILRRRKKAIRTEGAFGRTAQGDDSHEEKSGAENPLRDKVEQTAMQFGYRIEPTSAGLFQFVRRATREKIGKPRTLEEIARYLLTTHGKRP